MNSPDLLNRPLDASFLVHLQAAIDHSPACLIIAEAPSGQIIYINEAVRKFRGLTDAELLGIGIEQYVLSWKEYAPDGRPLSGAEMPLGRAILNGEVVENEEVIVELDDGSRKWALASAVPIRGAEGDIVAGLVIWYDITQQKAYEAELQRLANTDALTGVLNRRAFFSHAHAEWTRAVRHGHVFSLLLLDIDHFKDINDVHGHQAGDRVLAEIVATCTMGLRDADVFGRIGGEEFALILPETGRTGAQRVAEKLRGRAEAARTLHEGTVLRCTISLGCVTVCPGGDVSAGIEAALRRADAALYEAKRTGRNRVICAS